MNTTHTPEPTGLAWRKSSYSNGSGGACVEVASPPGGKRAVRDSKDPYGGVLVFTEAAWFAFVAAANVGEFDL